MTTATIAPTNIDAALKRIAVLRELLRAARSELNPKSLDAAALRERIDAELRRPI